jgi:uncharacterized protein involved in exopolysaccharide biosynthesis
MAFFGLGKKNGETQAKSKGRSRKQPVMDTSVEAAQPSSQGRRYSDSSDAYDNLTVADYAQGMPNIRLSEAVKSFGRQLKWVIPLFIIGTVVAFYATKDFKRTYQADGTLMVQVGTEHIYQPVSGQNGQNALQLTTDAIIQTEASIIKNPEVIDAVIGQMTSSPSDSLRFDRDAELKIRAAGGNQAAKAEAQMERRKRVESSFAVMPQAKSSIINLAYKHEDPTVAVETLNAFIDEYQAFRRNVFVEGSGDIISQRRLATEQQLNENERMIARFLQRNNISDFESEQEGAQKRTEDLKALLNTTRAQIAETEAALAIVEDQLRQTPAMIDLYIDDRASQRIAQAELELGQLLAKYLPTSDPVRQKQAELQELRSVQQGYNGQVVGGRRQGPNPVFQTLTTRRNTLQSTADAQREKEFTLQRQLDGADAKVRRLTQLNPEFQNLLRERKTLAERLDAYNTREQEALINQDQAEANNENVREISRARYAQKGRNMRAVMFLLASVFWGFVLFMIALARVFLDPRLYVAKTSRRTVERQPQTAPAPVYNDPIPEPVSPDFVPDEYQPATTPSHVPTPYAPAAAQQTAYQPYAEPTHAPSGTPQYATSAYAPDYSNQATMGAESRPVEWTPPAAQMQSDGMVTQPLGSSAAVDMYPNPYAPTLQTPQQAQNNQGMNVLGTLPPNSTV